MKKINFLHVLIFLSAFLLFQIELIISKIFLPAFGGSYLVWGACVVFFQAALLLGYAYAHCVLQGFGINKYRYFHLLLLALPLFFFPGRALPVISAHQQIPMSLDVFGQLSISIGLVFFVLSTTSIIFQGWLAASELPEHANPYVLYAVSNLGSFFALLSYPFIFEPFFDLKQQVFIWRISYAVLFSLHLIVARLINVRQQSDAEKKDLLKIRFGKEELSWLFLGASGVIFFLSVTNIITYEVAPIPLLWIIPLSIFLLSFVLVFKKRPWHPQWIKGKFHITVGFSVLLFFLAQKRILPFPFEVFFHLLFLFIICMFCQYELYARRPKDNSRLTGFYLIVAAGSFLGGVLVSWIVPLFAVNMIEYLLGLFCVSCALIINEKPSKLDLYCVRLIIYFAIIMTLWPIVFEDYNVFGVALIITVFYLVFSKLKTNPRMFNFSLAGILCCSVLVEPLWTNHRIIFKHRNYYGIYEIYNAGSKRLLSNGTTIHGAQYLIPKRRKEPLTYYHRITPVGEVMSSTLFNFSKIGVIGLGTGALASYINKDQEIDFFELDPDVSLIANRYFTYLKNCSGKLKVIFGDARISLNNSSDKRYDILIVDAFSGDSVPMHLLTTEALAQYRKRISVNGIILFHISNRYLDLVPVLFANAKATNSFASYRFNDKTPDGDAFASFWFALTWDEGAFNKLAGELKWKKCDPAVIRRLRPWTDDYSNIAAAIKLRNIFSKIKEFQPFYW